jgi:hypothetical protein
MQGSARQWRFAIAILLGALAAALLMPADRVGGETVPTQMVHTLQRAAAGSR